MKISLYSRISLDRDFLEYNLKKEDIATFIDTVPDPEDIEEGYILEVFNALGELINPVIVPPSAVVPLRSDEILSVRSLVTNELHGSLNSNKIMKLLKDLCKPLGLKKSGQNARTTNKHSTIKTATISHPESDPSPPHK